MDENGYYNLNSAGMIQADYNEDHYIYAGSTDAKHRLSWGGHLGFGGFTANFLFTARLGGVVVSKTQAVMDYFGVSQDSANARESGFMEFNGMKTNDFESYYKVIGTGPSTNGVMSQYVYDATNVRLAEISLGYDFPVAKWGCGWLNLSVVGNNLAMLYLKAPFDPEMTASMGTYNQGIDYFMQPSTRSLGFSVKVKFGGETAAKPAAPVTVAADPIIKEIIKEVPVEVVKEVKVIEQVPAKTLNGTYSDDLFFVIGRAEIRPDEALKLGQIVQLLKDNPEATITVTGHADSRTGTPAVNRSLSERRAAKLVEMLKKAGIDASRIRSAATGTDRDASKSAASNRVAVCIVK